jgi:hypothetical protein
MLLTFCLSYPKNQSCTGSLKEVHHADDPHCSARRGGNFRPGGRAHGTRRPAGPPAEAQAARDQRYGPNLSVYIARTKNYFAHALIIDCGDPPSLMQGMTSALAIEGTRIVALTCSTPPAKVLPGLKMPSPHDYVGLKRRAFYGVWRDVDRAALHYHVQKHDLKSVSANGGRVTLLYKCRHLHDLLYARLDTNPVFGVPEVVTRSCAAQGHEHNHRAMF